MTYLSEKLVTMGLGERLHKTLPHAHPYSFVMLTESLKFRRMERVRAGSRPAMKCVPQFPSISRSSRIQGTGESPRQRTAGREYLAWAERSGLPTAGAGELRGWVRVWSAESVVSASVGLSCYLEQNYERTEQRSHMSCFVERRKSEEEENEQKLG